MTRRGGAMGWKIIEGDCRDTLRSLPAGIAHTCVTSPPYFGLRDYGTAVWEGGDSACDHREVQAQNRPGRGTPGGRGGSFPTTERGYRAGCSRCGARRTDKQFGLEATPDEFVAALVGVFREVRRVLRDDGTVWLNLGDSYAATGTTRWPNTSDGYGNGYGKHGAWHGGESVRPGRGDGVKPKDLIGIPWMVAFALRADGWYLRSEIIWAKPNPMPESVTDRPTKAHEQIFLLSKGPRYFYDAGAIREADGGQDHEHRNVLGGQPSLEPSNGLRSTNGGLRTVEGRNGSGRNKRSVWTVATQPYPGAHFATFPPRLIEPCVLAGCPEGGTVLDAFAGAGSTGLVAVRNGRSFIGCELSAEYAAMARDRIETDLRLGHRSPYRPPEFEGELAAQLVMEGWAT